MRPKFIETVPEPVRRLYCELEQDGFGPDVQLCAIDYRDVCSLDRAQVLPPRLFNHVDCTYFRKLVLKAHVDTMNEARTVFWKALARAIVAGRDPVDIAYGRLLILITGSARQAERDVVCGRSTLRRAGHVLAKQLHSYLFPTYGKHFDKERAAAVRVLLGDHSFSEYHAMRAGRVAGSEQSSAG